MRGERAARRRPASGLTLGELGCVLACLAVLAAAILPAMARSGWRMRRERCAANLRLAARGMLQYAADHDGAFPKVDQGRGMRRFDVVGQCVWRAYRKGVSNSRNLFHAVRLKYVSPERMVCPDTEDQPAPLSVQGQACHDFAAGDGRDYVGRFSYSYHLQFSRRSDGVRGYPLTTSSDPRMAVLADRTPLIAYASGRRYGDGFGADAWGVPVGIAAERANSPNHGRSGQNVARVTGAVEWARVPTVGVSADNIYTVWRGGDRSGGAIALDSMPGGPADSFLVP